MVPAKAVRQDLKTETNTIVYMPLATTQNPGVVQVGEGLLINADGVLSFDRNEISILQIAKNGVIIPPDENKVVNIVLTKDDVGLSNVDNTSDMNKPVSIYQQKALDTKIDKFAGVSHKDKVLTVGADGYVTYKPLKMLATYNDGNKISDDTDSYNFTSLFVVEGGNTKNLTIDGSSQLKESFRSVRYNATNGVLTFVRLNGSELNIDLPLELLIKSGYYEDETMEIVLVLANDEQIRIPVSELVNNYYADENTLTMIKSENGFTLSVKNAGITTDKIADYSVTDNKIVTVSGDKVLGSVSEAVKSTLDSAGNMIVSTYRRIDDSYSKNEMIDILALKADYSQLPYIKRTGGL
jgi:hypothetical protein